MDDARQRHAETNRAVLGLLVLRRYSADRFADVVAQVEGLAPSPENLLALLSKAGAEVRLRCARACAIPGFRKIP